MTRALVCHGAGDIRVEPREAGPPGPGEALVRLTRGGICGSDLHYWRHGGFGAIRIREPMVLGHEAAGVVEAAGEGVGLAPGTPVALNPSLPCGACDRCAAGLPNHCREMRFFGSAMRMPHVQGAFREAITVEAARCVPAPGLDPAKAALAEPLAVCLHALGRAGALAGRRVLVTGCGPIGCLTVAAAVAEGAEVVAVDPVAQARDHALAMGAARDAAPGEEGEGFHVAFECSGAPPALAACVAALEPRGVLVQLGLGGDMTVPVQAITAKEIDLRGSFRFHDAFARAVEALATGRIDPAPLVTHALPLDEAEVAFALAADRTRAMKVQLAF